MRPPSEVFVWTPPRRNSKVVNGFVVHLLVDVRSRCVVTPRLVANNDYVTVPSLRPRRGFAAFAKCFRVGNTRHQLQCRLTICNRYHPLQLIALRLALPRDIQHNTTSMRLSCRRSFLCCFHRLVYKIWSVCTNHYPENRLAITTLRTLEARSAQSNIDIVRFQSYAPTLRCRCVATTRLHPFGKGNDFFAHPSWSKDFITTSVAYIVIALY